LHTLRAAFHRERDRRVRPGLVKGPPAVPADDEHQAGPDHTRPQLRCQVLREAQDRRAQSHLQPGDQLDRQDRDRRSHHGARAEPAQLIRPLAHDLDDQPEAHARAAAYCPSLHQVRLLLHAA